MNGSSRTEWWRPDAVVSGSAWWRPFAALDPRVADSPVPFWGLMTFTFILLIAPQSFFPALAPWRIALLTGAVAITTHLVDRLIRGQPLMILTGEMWVTACLVAWAILTVPLSYWPGGSVSFLLEFYFKTLAIFWLLSNTVSTPSRLRAVAWGLSLMAGPIAASALTQYFAGHFIGGGAVKRIVGYEASLLENPNDLALMLNLILPLSVALLLANRQRSIRTVLLVIILLEGVGVIVTFSRAGFLTLATIFAIYAWKLRNRPERGWLAAALALVLLCTPLLPSAYLDRLGTITDTTSDPTGSAQERWRDTVSAVRFVLANPVIGAGVGTNILALNQERGPSWRAVHNAYLEYAVELGIPGLVLFLLLLVGCVKSVRFVQRRCVGVPIGRELFTLAEGVEISLLAFAFAALFHPVAYHVYFYYVAGLAVAVKAVYEAAQGKAGSAQE